MGAFAGGRAARGARTTPSVVRHVQGARAAPVGLLQQGAAPGLWEKILRRAAGHDLGARPSWWAVGCEFGALTLRRVASGHEHCDWWLGPNSGHDDILGGVP